MKNLILWILLALLIGVILSAALAPSAWGQELPPRTLDKRFGIVATATLGTAALDAWSTNRNLDRGYTENNMILGTRPAKWNVWALCMGESAGWTTAAYFVKRATRKSPSKFIRNLWVVLPGLSFLGHSVGWVHNVSIYDPRYPRVQ